MTHISSKPGRWLASGLLAAGMVGCSGGDLTLPRPDVAVVMSVVGGDQQIGTVGEPLPKPLIVQLRDETGAIVVGRRVMFVVTDGPAAATFAPDTVVSDGDGQALGKWTLGTTPGVYAAQAHVLPLANATASEFELPAVQFTASARPGQPDTVYIESETFQIGQRGSAVAQAPTLRAVDRFGNPVEGAVVTWRITAGNGSLDTPTVAADSDGRVSVIWTLGTTRVNRVEAVFDGAAETAAAVFSAVIIF